jgi:hypothetical protein
MDVFFVALNHSLSLFLTGKGYKDTLVATVTSTWKVTDSLGTLLDDSYSLKWILTVYLLQLLSIYQRLTVVGQQRDFGAPQRHYGPSLIYIAIPKMLQFTSAEFPSVIS